MSTKTFSLKNRSSQLPQREGCGACTNCPIKRWRPRIGLVLGGGGAKAAAHVGVFRVLEQAGIKVDAVSAASAGALVGLFFSAGYSADEMLQIMNREVAIQGWKRWVPGSQWVRMLHLLRRGGLQRLIRRYISVRNLEDLKIPLAVSATDLERGEVVYLDQGPIETALMATMSLPGVGLPVLHAGRHLVDGSVLCDMPVEPLNRRSVDVKVGVNLVGLPRSEEAPIAKTLRRWSSWNVISQSIAVQLSRLTMASISQLDVVIRPEFGTLGMTDFRRMECMASAGQRAAHHGLGSVLQAMQSKQPACRRRAQS